MTDQIVQALLSHGSVGIIAGIFVWLYIRELGEHQKTRDKAQKDTESHAKEKHDLMHAHAALERGLYEQVNELREAHAIRERESLRTIEFFSKSTVEAVEELGRIAQAMRKAYERARR